MRRPPIACLIVAAAGAARAQTMLDQEHRLIEVHSLLVDMGALNAPGAYRERDLSLGLEVIVIPGIDGTTGGKRQITASDRTPVFPRLRLALGLPAPEGFRASVGIAYIPPIRLRDVSSHFAALEGEMAYAPGPLALGLRGHVLVARSMSPVTEPTVRDTLDNFEFGANAAAGYRLDFQPGSVTPYASIGITRTVGIFRVTSIRKGFAGGGFDGGTSLPKKMASAAGIPGADLIPETAELFLGFTSTQKAGRGLSGPPGPPQLPCRLDAGLVVAARYAFDTVSWSFKQV